jgi:N,N-dimethylformamidase
MADRRELLGYAVPMVAKPGETVRFMVTTEADRFDAEIVRLVHGDTNPEGPGFKAERIETSANGSYPGRHQETFIGSYATISPHAALDVSAGVSIQAWIWPTTPDLEHRQGVLTRLASGRGYGLFIENGAVTLQVGDATLTTPPGLVRERWHLVAATYDAASGDAHVEWTLVEKAGDRREAASGALSGDADASGLPLLVAAGGLRDVGRPAPVECFNGKIEGPRVFTRALDASELTALAAGRDPLDIDGIAAAWDFAATPAYSSEVADAGPHGLDGVLLNYPMRGLTGHTWDGSVFLRDAAPDQYGAIHFHDDDFEDSGWEADFEFLVPADLRSGFYAAHLRGAGEEDHIPFFVSPPAGERSAGIAYLAPTNTYLAYANERLLSNSGGADFSGLTNIPIEMHQLDVVLGEHREYGGSIYDLHTDGSGIAYSSSRRPIVSMRPTHRHWVTGAPRALAFDLYLVDWLEEKGFAYDVFTDEDLHFQGLQRLSGYKVVLTGSHPEYWSAPMLDALETYLADGGRLMYLGGNGFYWATAFDPERPHVIEVRRGIAGSRVWNSHPGEQQMASTGEMCGIWRHLGRPPNEITGIGFAGQGWDLDTPGYRRLPDSHDARAAFIFEGIGDDEEIGEFGLVMNGAAGDELDRADHTLGTPHHALVLATSAGLHSDYYLVCHEDMLVTQKQIHGSDNPNVRADMVYFETPGDGAVFSVGSINWLGSLSHNGYDNNVSRITENVLRRFAD